HDLAMLNLALADASIASYDTKYTYERWRPITAIQSADTDGNDATQADPTWTPFLSTPATPTYASDQSAYAGAAEIVLKNILGDAFAPQIATASLPGVTRSYATLTQASEEAGRSQIYGGTSFETDNQRGLTMGRDIGRLVLQILA